MPQMAAISNLTLASIAPQRTRRAHGAATNSHGEPFLRRASSIRNFPCLPGRYEVNDLRDCRALLNRLRSRVEPCMESVLCPVIDLVTTSCTCASLARSLNVRRIALGVSG